MSWGVALRNGVAIGLGSIISLFSGQVSSGVQNSLLTEAGDYLLQEDGSRILLE